MTQDDIIQRLKQIETDLAQVRASLATPISLPLPKLAVKTGKQAAEEYGIWVAATGGTGKVYSDLLVERFGTNVSIQHYPGTVSMDNVRLLDGYGPLAYDGQGIYADATGGWTIRNSIIGYNGRPRNLPNVIPNIHSHGGYFNVGAGAVTVEDSIIVGNASAGLQFRNPSVTNIIRRSLIIDNGIGLLNVMGNLILDDVWVIGGHFQSPDQGMTANGNTAILAYWPVVSKDSKYIGLTGQGSDPKWFKGSDPYPSGAFSLGGTWRHNEIKFVQPPAGPLLDFVGTNEAYGWPGEVFAGAGADRVSGTLKNRTLAIAYDPMFSVLDAIENRISVPAAIARIKSELGPKL